MAKTIPLIDFDCFHLDREDADQDRFQSLVDDVRNALTTFGFMYLVNHGIPDEKIKDLFTISKKFFNLPKATKVTYTEKTDVPFLGGYLGLESKERLGGKNILDLKESFSYSAKGAPNIVWPTAEVPELRGSMEDIWARCIELNKRILDVIGHALQLEDPQYFSKRHVGIGTSNNFCHMRTFYYLAPERDSLKEKLDSYTWCGEHTDLGGITLLFQDMTGGLEIKDPDGNWVKATPVEGSIVVNLGDVMQRWTGDRLVAGIHRVVMPSKPVVRQSIGFFGKPDDDVTIVCIDGEEKYPSITGRDSFVQPMKGPVVH